MRARKRSGAERGGAVTQRTVTRPRIIIIDAGRGETIAGKHTRIFLLYFVIFFFIYCFLIDSSEAPANEVLISIYTFDSLSNNIETHIFLVKTLRMKCVT